MIKYEALIIKQLVRQRLEFEECSPNEIPKTLFGSKSNDVSNNLSNNLFNLPHGCTKAGGVSGGQGGESMRKFEAEAHWAKRGLKLKS